MKKIFGYARVSAKDQNEARQTAAFKKMNVPVKNIYLDKLSGKNFNRPKYQKLRQRLDENSLLYLKSLDRLGRNYREILEEWRYITRVKGADIVVIDMPLLDTRRGKDLLGSFLSDVVLQVLSFVAENERDSIRQRQAEGIAAARKRGVRFGRPPKPLPEGFLAERVKWRRGEATLKQAAQNCGMALSTFYVKAKAGALDFQ